LYLFFVCIMILRALEGVLKEKGHSFKRRMIGNDTLLGGLGQIEGLLQCYDSTR
jgi:hypothetical protein